MAHANSYQASQVAVKGDKAQGHGKNNENIWSSLLDSVASGKRLPGKTIILLGIAPW
jgi:hypothetical protein